MIQLIPSGAYGEFGEQLQQMHRLRHRVFKRRLNWGVESNDGMEVDRFDALRPVYLLQSSSDGRISGCVRLLPTSGPTMLRDVFPELLAGHAPPARHDIWESSRFALDLPPSREKATGGLAKATCELFAGMIEFGLSRSLIDIVTVTDLRIERILRRAGWPLRRLGAPRPIGTTTAVAGYLEISPEALRSVYRAGAITGPVLWAPVLAVVYAAALDGECLAQPDALSLLNAGKGGATE
jgi:acyl homoserine lactone synthase